MGKAKKDLTCTLEADLREWVDVDVDELEEEELVKKYAKISAFEKKIGFGTKSIFVKNMLESCFQVIKTETHFLFHYLGKKIYKDNYCFNHSAVVGDFFYRDLFRTWKIVRFFSNRIFCDFWYFFVFCPFCYKTSGTS